jgi:hypothetical protein
MIHDGNFQPDILERAILDDSTISKIPLSIRKTVLADLFKSEQMDLFVMINFMTIAQMIHQEYEYGIYPDRINA